MSSGFSGGGGPEFLGGGGRSMVEIGSSLIDGNQGSHRFQQHQQVIPGILADPSSQIGHRRLDLIGKRSLADFQTYQQIHLQHQQKQQPPFALLQQQLQQQQLQQSLTHLQRQQQQQGLGLFLRSVKQKINYQNHALDSCSPNITQEIPSSLSISPDTRFGVPVYQQLRPNPISLINNNYSNVLQNPLVSANPVLNPIFSGNGCFKFEPKSDSVGQETKNNSTSTLLDTLQELEKQLLDDNDENGDAVSVITNSEWSETFQNLMGPSPVQTKSMIASSSPTSSSSSSSCSSSAVSPPATKQLITDAAAAISEGKTETATEILARLSQVANAKGNPEQRLVAYMGNALRSRACPNDYPPPVMELYSKEHIGCMYSLLDLSPCFKFGLLAANLVMLEAIALEKATKVHIVDFDFGHGGQYLNLIHSLAERQSPIGRLSTEVKITAVTTELVRHTNGNNGVESVRDGLFKLAERVGVALKFNSVTRTINELTRVSLGCEEDEAVVVNSAFNLYRLPDESVSVENLRDELLRRVKGLRPRVVTLVEQEMNGNTAPFLTRVSEACGYYGTLFDSLDSTIPRDNMDRVRIEEGLGRKLANSVACEGRERVERCEVFGKWRARMGMAGFQLDPLSQSVTESIRSKLNSARGVNPGFTVREDNGGVGFGWMGRTLTVASAWR
ncbi:hypothetical protein Nepgr_010803 [Nepenthes gracilis]|uniref:Scarecrow-like protein 8 n=1 Tax=Nepenthes gracilis TaxID=150966 RepID=A0AAD3SD36_NEPGR|nr:hypothetical protein Nepgr_010803 [Nepenthes gracilis]